jgi:hypothetical protein
MAIAGKGDDNQGCEQYRYPVGVHSNSPYCDIRHFSATVIVDRLLSTLNGPVTMSTVAVNGPATSFGSRHESGHVPPHPYSKVKVRS